MNLSPKALVAFVIPIAASALLWLITGNDTYLVGILLGLVTGGGAVLAPPAEGVTQQQVAALSPARSPRRR